MKQLEHQDGRHEKWWGFSMKAMFLGLNLYSIKYLQIFCFLIILIIGYRLVANDTSLVKNSQFEILENGKVKGWTSWNWAPGKQVPDAKMSCEAGKGRNFTNALRIEVNKEKHVGVWCNTPSTINAISGEKYLLNVWLYPESEKILAFEISASFVNINGEANKKAKNATSKIFNILPGCGWQLLSLPVEIPKEYNCVRVDLKLRSTGAIFIDDMSFELEKEVPTVPGIPYLLCGKAAASPVIDGILDDKCWRENIECLNFLLTQERGLAQGTTSARVTYDSRNIYFAFKCEEKFLKPELNQMERFKGTCKEKDGPVWSDDCVEIFIKGKAGKKYQIAVNSLGTVYDSVVDTPDGPLWDSNAKVATYVGNGSWTVEIAVPILSIAENINLAGKIWRINLCRTRHPVYEFSSWSPVPRSFHDDKYWGYIGFADKVPGISFSALKYTNNNSIEFAAEVDFQDSVNKNYLCTNISIDNKYQWNTTDTINIGNSKNGFLNIKKNLPEMLNGINCRYADLEYSLVSKNNFVYKSPVFRFKIGKASFVISSAFGKLFTNDEVRLKTIKDVNIIEGETEEIVLMLNSTKYHDLPENIEFSMDMPFACSLISPMHSRDSASPVEVKESLITRDYESYRHYNIKLPRSIIKESDGPEWDIIPVHFFIKMNGSDKNINNGKIYFHSYIPELKYTEEEQNINIKVLPPLCRKKISGKHPFIIWPWWPFYSVTQHGRLERESIFSKWQNAGFNTVSTELQLNTTEYRKFLHDSYKFNLMKMVPALTANPVPGSKEYLSEHPDEKETTLAGYKVACVCFADMLEGKSAFAGKISEIIGNMARHYQLLHVDYEFGIFNQNSPGYSERNIEMFRKRNGISEKEELNTKTLMGKYRMQWIDFRCWQNGEMFKIYKDAIKKSNPDCMFGAYSAYQRETSKRDNYGADWTYLAKYLDLVMCGYGRGDYKATQAVSGKDKLFNGGEGIWERVYDTTRTEINLFRRLTDSGLFMIFYNGIDDGNVYEAASKVIGVASDFDDFFNTLTRADNLVDVLNSKDIPPDTVSVLLNQKGERLIFIFNESDKEKEFVISNKNILPKIKTVDYFDKKIMEDAEKIHCNIHSGKTKILYLCHGTDKEPASPKTLIPDSKNPSSSSRPVFIWEDKGRTNLYYLECREKGKDASVKKINSIKENFSYSDFMLTPGNYEWRVCAEDIISKMQSPWSAWADFTVPVILNSDAIPEVVAQGEKITFTADFPTGGDWILNLIDSAGNKAGSFKGQGKKIEVKFDGSIDKSVLKEGAYKAMFYGNGILGAEVPFTINNKMSSSNPSIENLGIWIPMQWEGGYEVCEDKLYLAKDYDVTRSNSYSLRIIKRDHINPSWVNYHRAPSGTRMISVKPGEKYRFSVWVKNKGEKVKSKISISYMNESKYFIPGNSAYLSGENDWALVSATSTVPPSAVRLYLGLSSNSGNGTSWFDCFMLEKIE